MHDVLDLDDESIRRKIQNKEVPSWSSSLITAFSAVAAAGCLRLEPSQSQFFDLSSEKPGCSWLRSQEVGYGRGNPCGRASKGSE
ncbi:hypothetical protein CMV_010814 [Castanea mollissima]|uniref:Uncharacterized protein n=1 Tax=Castanea mollissima TaxID=60419 RepID=A0A8J4W0H8_9ROSI|nr:hypothetical protein CMV_010814 [Castanea mollissima]